MKAVNLKNQIFPTDNKTFRPSEFMRARRPYLFSDSEAIEEQILPNATFEYHLDTLTSRKQEYEFEHFARKLAEKEICPNLIPQTGPTGGGDGKVDTETYPVADEISSRWYQGIPDSAGKERWAFAFSAKKKWKGKVETDVEKIANTDRDYKLVYFITNQFIKASTRTQVEEDLTKKHSLQVRILDRSWLVECVFEHDRMQLAIETLNITGFESKIERKKGGRDIVREEELRELENQIKDVDRYKGIQYQLVEDCLQAALLARGLERPRTEVDGLFARAERIAKKVDNAQQKLRVLYNRAWTAFWWYDDFEELNSIYDAVEELAVDSGQMSDLGRLTNLWTLLIPTLENGQLDNEKAKIKQRSKTLREELKKLADDKSRPSNSLWARTELVLIDLKAVRENVDLRRNLFRELKSILMEIDGLSSYPVETITGIITEMGDFISDNEDFDDLFELVVDIKKRRTSEAEAGRALLKRGYQKIRGGKNYDAIKLLGRAQQHLAMHENRPEFAEALAGCGHAYKSVGLLWAARANFIAAANQAISEYAEDGEIIPATLAYLRRIIWIEIQLGRVPCVLEWMRAANVIAGYVLFNDEEETERFLEERKIQDCVLAILLLKTDFWELKWLYFLPQVLESENLLNSWMALLYALGYEDYLRKENVIPNTESPESVKEFFNSWLNQPANAELPVHPEFLRKQKISLKSVILGCEISIETPNEIQSIYFTETILGALESFFATCIDKQVFSIRSEFKIKIVPSINTSRLPEYQTVEIDSEQVLEIRYGSNVFGTTYDERIEFREWLQNSIINIGLKIVLIGEPESFIKELIGDELGLGRALNFSEVSIPIENILGKSPRFKLSDWKPEHISENFPVKIKTPWNQGIKLNDNKSEAKLPELEYGNGKPPEDLFNVENLKHTDIQTQSFIDMDLWDKAGWQGNLYIVFPELDSPPLMAIGFKDIEAGKAIFRGWRKKLGDDDKNDEIRVSIITGINKQFPSHYKVLISANPKKANSKNNLITIVSRIHYMEASSTKNLDMFLKRYERVKTYGILPAHLPEITDIREPSWDLTIIKREIFITPAWQISDNSPDSVAIKEDDEPIIPEGVDASAILNRLKNLASKKKW